MNNSENFLNTYYALKQKTNNAEEEFLSGYREFKEGRTSREKSDELEDTWLELTKCLQDLVDENTPSSGEYVCKRSSSGNYIVAIPVLLNPAERNYFWLNEERGLIKPATRGEFDSSKSWDNPFETKEFDSPHLDLETCEGHARTYNGRNFILIGPEVGYPKWVEVDNTVMSHISNIVFVYKDNGFCLNYHLTESRDPILLNLLKGGMPQRESEKLRAALKDNHIDAQMRIKILKKWAEMAQIEGETEEAKIENVVKKVFTEYPDTPLDHAGCCGENAVWAISVALKPLSKTPLKVSEDDLERAAFELNQSAVNRGPKTYFKQLIEAVINIVWDKTRVLERVITQTRENVFDLYEIFTEGEELECNDETPLEFFERWQHGKFHVEEINEWMRWMEKREIVSIWYSMLQYMLQIESLRHELA